MTAGEYSAEASFEDHEHAAVLLNHVVVISFQRKTNRCILCCALQRNYFFVYAVPLPFPFL